MVLIEKEKIEIITWFLAFYLVLASLDFLPVIPGVSLSRILVIIPIGVCLLYLTHMKLCLDRFFFIAFFYLIIITLSIFYSYDTSATGQRIVTLGMNIGAILVLSMLRYNNKEINTIKKAMVLSGWFTVLLMIIYSETSLLGGRMTIVINGVHQDPNYLIGFLIFSIIYYYDDFLEKREIKSIINIVIFMVFVILTGSRGGLLAIIGSILFYNFIWMKAKGFNIKALSKIITIIIIWGILFYAALDMLPESIGLRYDPSFTYTDGGAGRGDIWSNIIYCYNSAPVFHKLFGWGAGTIRHFNYGRVAHNIWLESLIEIGIIGSLIFFVFYYINLKKAYVMKEFVVAATFIGYIIMGISMSLYSYKPIWNIILLITILKNRERELNNISKNEI